MDYAAWLKRASEFTESRRALPGEVRIEQQIAAPLTDREIDKLAKQSRLPIPEPLRRFWREAGAFCKCTYWWQPPPAFEQQLRIASPKRQFDCVWGGIEMDTPEEIVSLLESCVDWAEHFRPDYPKDARFWEFSIPIFPVPNGDHVGLYVRDSAANPPVAYLCHEGSGGSNIIAASFEDFLARWEVLGFVGIDFLMAFRNRRTGMLEPGQRPTQVLALQTLLQGVERRDLVPQEPEFMENDWMQETEPRILEEWLEQAGRLDERKTRLYCCACCRRVWNRLGATGQRAVEVSERFADGLASEVELAAARDALRGPGPNRRYQLEVELAQGAIDWAEQFAKFDPTQPLDDVTRKVLELGDILGAEVQFGRSEGLMHGAAYGAVDAMIWKTWEITQHLDEPELSVEKQAQCDLLRHIFGNPFRPPPDSGPFSSRVQELASRLYFGVECQHELRSALASEGHEQQSEHFERADHPRGCWAWDLIRQAS